MYQEATLKTNMAEAAVTVSIVLSNSYKHIVRITEKHSIPSIWVSVKR